jgi:hypothetical protein
VGRSAVSSLAHALGILTGVRFRGTVELGGKTATGLQVPNDVIDALGGGKRPAVRITIGGHTYRTTVASRGGRFLVPLSAENRAAAGVAAGEEVEVDIQSDTASREVPVPADLAGELTRDSTAQRFFNGLSYTHRKDGCAGSKSWRDDWVTGTCFAQSDSEPTAESRAPWSSLAKASWPWRTRLLLAQGRSELRVE